MKKLKNWYHLSLAVLTLTYLPQQIKAQSIFKTWISVNNHHYLKIIDSFKAIYIYDDYATSPVPQNCKIIDTTIILYGTTYPPKDSTYLNTPSLYHTKLLTDDSLILEYKAANEFDNNQTIVFLDSQALYDSKFFFDSLFFSTSTCYGSCPETAVWINKSGKIFFTGEKYTNRFQGNFTGQLKKRQLKKLNGILYKSAITTFPATTPVIFDAPKYDFNIYYKNGATFFSGYYFPFYNNDLFNFLLNYKKFHLKKCTNCEPISQKP